MRTNNRVSVLLVLFVGITTNAAASQQCVILLHALARTTYSMSTMATYLERAHYVVINSEYPTTKKSIESLAEENLATMIAACRQHHTRKINFVTHSIGGLVLRAYLYKHPLRNLGRIVMLAPPNHGSPLADLLQNNWLFNKIAGPAGRELTTTESGARFPLTRTKPYEIGIIAGNFSFNPFSKMIFHEDNDGKVGVSSTRIPGMTDFLVLPVSHMFMPQNPVAIREVDHFLHYGKFARRKGNKPIT